MRVALADRRAVLQSVESLGLETPLPFVETGPVHAALSAGLGYVAELSRQFQYAQALLCHLAGRIPRRSLPRCR